MTADQTAGHRRVPANPETEPAAEAAAEAEPEAEADPEAASDEGTAAPCEPGTTASTRDSGASGKATYDA